MPRDTRRAADESRRQSCASPAAPLAPAPPVHYAGEAQRAAAEEVSSRLGSELRAGVPDDSSQGICLLMDEGGLWLCGDGLRTQGDFVRLLPRLSPHALARELLVRAARIRDVEHPHAIDATAGMGEDSLLLATAGFEVDLYERDPVICELLRDALRRASGHPELAPVVARMRLHCGDSTQALLSLAEERTRPDVVFLDPMFPARQKSALVKKKFQLIHRLEAPAMDEEELLEAALGARPRKVVIKRPPKGPQLAEKKPSYSITGKAVRYDVIVPPQ